MALKDETEPEKVADRAEPVRQVLEIIDNLISQSRCLKAYAEEYVELKKKHRDVPGNAPGGYVRQRQQVLSTMALAQQQGMTQALAELESDIAELTPRLRLASPQAVPAETEAQ